MLYFRSRECCGNMYAQHSTWCRDGFYGEVNMESKQDLVCFFSFSFFSSKLHTRKFTDFKWTEVQIVLKNSTPT